MRVAAERMLPCSHSTWKHVLHEGPNMVKLAKGLIMALFHNWD